MDEAISLPSSNIILTFDNDSYDENILFKLLDEAQEKNLEDKAKILTTKRVLPDDKDLPEDAFDEDGRFNVEHVDHYWDFQKEILTYGELKELYFKYKKYHYRGSGLYEPAFLHK